MEPKAILQRFQALAGELRASKERRQSDSQYIFRTDNPKHTTDLFSEYDITYEELTTGLFTVELSNCISEAEIFLTEENFRQRIDRLVDPSMHLRKHVGILEDNDETIFYDCQSLETFVEGVIKINYLISNSLQTHRVISELKKDSFADYMNHQRGELVIHSATKGILKIAVPEYPIKLNPAIDYKSGCELLMEKLSSKDFTIHFKNQLFTLSRDADKSPIESLFNHLAQLIQSADNDYQLQLKNFSFEKFKTDLQKEKEKYFNTLRELLNKILGQVVGVPVSIAASTYATYKVENGFVFVLIAIALGLYVCFAVYFQWLYWTDLIEIEVDLERDFTKIETNSGLPKIDIDLEKIKVIRRIKSIRRTIRVYISMVIILFVMFILFMVNQLLTPSLTEKMKVLFAHLTTR